MEHAGTQSPQAACSAAGAENVYLNGVQLVLISSLCEIMLPSYGDAYFL